MDMCYDGALVIPSSYAVMDEEEMMYVEGGAYYSGIRGWVVAGFLSGIGKGIVDFAKITAEAIKGYVLAMFTGGPLGVLSGVITSVILGAGLFSLTYLGGQFISAGLQAAGYMATKGHFNINANDNIFSIISVTA